MKAYSQPCEVEDAGLAGFADSGGDVESPLRTVNSLAAHYAADATTGWPMLLDGGELLAVA